MKLYGLIGFPLSHSFSEKYFTAKFDRENIKDAVYKLFPIQDIHQLPRLVSDHKELKGINVTIPYKEQVLHFLHSTDENIGGLGAVNTIKIFRSGDHIHLKGFNTDVYGFNASLQPLLKDYYKKAIILGTGGASKAVAYVLENMGFSVTFVSRAPKKAGHISYGMLSSQIILENLLIVNTSPLGMYPKLDTYPDIPYEYLTSKHLLYDLVYNPEETMFMKMGKLYGSRVMNGMQMLELQAEKAWQIWNED